MLKSINYPLKGDEWPDVGDTPDFTQEEFDQIYNGLIGHLTAQTQYPRLWDKRGVKAKKDISDFYHALLIYSTDCFLNMNDRLWSRVHVQGDTFNNWCRYATIPEILDYYRPKMTWYFGRLYKARVEGDSEIPFGTPQSRTFTYSVEMEARDLFHAYLYTKTGDEKDILTLFVYSLNNIGVENMPEGA